MSSYIGAVQIGSGDQVLIGSTLYGVCNTGATTAAKVVTLSSFDALINGVTVHVRFANGNTVTSGLTLQVGSTTAYSITGNCVCGTNEIIAFTYETDGTNHYWRANHSIKIETANNIITSIAGQEINAATQTYVDNKTAGLSGLTGAMHFKGSVNPLPTATDSSTFSAYDAGDVVLGPNNKEYVYNKGVNANSSEWIELGDEGSYALKSSTDTITEVGTFTANTLPTLTVTPVSIPNVTNAGSTPSLTVTPVSIPNVTDAGSATTASVSAGVLSITIGEAPTLGTDISVGSASDWNAGSTPTLGTAISVGSASGWNAGSQASLTTNDTTVVVPGTVSSGT